MCHCLPRFTDYTRWQAGLEHPNEMSILLRVRLKFSVIYEGSWNCVCVCVCLCVCVVIISKMVLAVQGKTAVCSTSSHFCARFEAHDYAVFSSMKIFGFYMECDYLIMFSSCFAFTIIPVGLVHTVGILGNIRGKCATSSQEAENWYRSVNMSILL